MYLYLVPPNICASIRFFQYGNKIELNLLPEDVVKAFVKRVNDEDIYKFKINLINVCVAVYSSISGPEQTRAHVLYVRTANYHREVPERTRPLTNSRRSTCSMWRDDSSVPRASALAAHVSWCRKRQTHVFQVCTQRSFLF